MRRLLPWLLLAVLVASGCGGARLSRAGTTVALSPDVPRGSCETVGDLVGRAGGTNVAGKPRRRLAEYALNDLRNKAARLGATHVTAGPIQFGRTDGQRESATVAGSAYRCSRVAPPSSTEEAYRRVLLAAAPAAVGDCAERQVLSAIVTFDAEGDVVDVASVYPPTARDCLFWHLVRVQGPRGAEATLPYDFARAVFAGTEPAPDRGAASQTHEVAGEAAPTESSEPADPAPAPSASDDGDEPHRQRLRSLIDEQREDVLSCVAAERTAVRLIVSGGLVTVTLHGPLAGSPEEECVQTLLRDLDATGAPDLELIHVVRGPSGS